MKVKRIPQRRKFASEWEEIAYLRDKLLFWLYERENADKGRPYAKRLEQKLLNADPNQQAILGQECRSLIHEARGDLKKAIEHRTREIALIRRLHDLSLRKPNNKPALRGYGVEDLSDRLDLLAILHHERGNRDEAISTLLESKQLCKKHGLEFDGEDILQEYLEEKNAAGG